MGGQSCHRSAGIATVATGVLRALSISTPAALLYAPTTLAQTFEPTALTADIPAKPLAQALEAFARQTGLQLVYVSGVVRDQRSHAVSAGSAPMKRSLESSRALGSGSSTSHRAASASSPQWLGRRGRLLR